MSESSELKINSDVRVIGPSIYNGCTGIVTKILTGTALPYMVGLSKPSATACFAASELELVKAPRDLHAVVNETRVVNEQTGGAKGSKPQRFSLLPWDVLSKLAEHYAKGAAKYTRYGECNCANAENESMRAACVEAVTTNGLSDGIPSTPSVSVNNLQNGSTNTTTNPNPKNPIIAATPMGSLKTSTMPTSQGLAGYAERHPSTLTTTTAATRTDRAVETAFGGHSAIDATLGLDTSKDGTPSTARRHAPGCPALTIVSPGDHNWRKGYDWSLSIDALGRHLAAFIEGETYDPETGSHHMLAVMFHAASLVYFTDEFPELDDRRNTKGANDRAE